ncbi:probable ATP-dependent RNA helicase spindle-E isoform X2 [Paramacrobiotus metropolitanus]|uniref:probable ATP-dependent RNA helicase spindle-E isoform X2 n=1 Tax=Paramacrobiotus metropolitanus TaxID=2943436 RepID=UPI002445766A|nr:probable ATP-dependent RNA helicase spindle-E isoform X2 [Paramacrobiotus metropolitanus]
MAVTGAAALRAHWKPTLPAPRGRPAVPSADEFQKWMKEQDDLRKNAQIKIEDDNTIDIDEGNQPSSADLTIPSKTQHHYELVHHNGKEYWRRRKNDTEDWNSFYLEKLRLEGMRIEEANDDPYKFEADEMDFENQRYLERCKLFGGEDDVASDTVEEKSPQDDLLNLLYGDIPFEDEDVEVERQQVPPTPTEPHLRRRIDYQRFYNLSQPFDYDTDLPVYHHKDEVLDSVRSNRVTIVVGCTGSGKTTQIPLYILDSCAEANEPCNIVVTQPRRLAAVTNAVRVASLRNGPTGRKWKLGHLVGFHVGMSKRISPLTRLTFCTTAILLKTIGSDLNLGRFTHIILDEVHERDQDTDLSLMLVKKMMLENSRHVKLIIMSATMDFEKIASYFTRNHASLNPNKIEIEQLNNVGIDEYFLDELWPNTQEKPWPKFDLGNPKIDNPVAKYLVELIAELPAQAGSGKCQSSSAVGAVLVFLPGMSDIEDFAKILVKESEKNGYDWEIMGLHSILSSELQQNIMRTPLPHIRRIILSTNIAESSITIPYVVFVVDLGLTKRLIVDRELDIPRLAVQWASKANMTQRKGRCGRVQRGAYFCLLPRQFHDKFSAHEEPEMKLAPIHHSLLHVKVLNLPKAFKPHHLFALLLDPPARREIDIGILQLKEVGALSLYMDGRVSRDNGEITKLGRILERLPVSISVGRLVVLSHMFGMLDDGITLAAGLSIRNVFLASISRADALQNWKEKQTIYGAGESDCLAVLMAYEKYRAMQKLRSTLAQEEKWCDDNLLSMQRMREMDNTRTDLCFRLEEIGLYNHSLFQKMTPLSLVVRDDLLRVLIAGSFYPLYFRQNPIDSQVASNELPYGDPSLSVYFKYLPEFEGPLYEQQLQQILDPLQLRSEIPPQIIYKDDNRHSLTSGQYGVCSGVQLLIQSLRRERKNDMLTVVEAPPWYRDFMKQAEENWRSNRAGVLSSFLFAATPEQRTPVIPAPYLPPFCQSEIRIIVCHVLSPVRIFVREHSRNKDFEFVMAELQKFKTNPPPVLVGIMPGDFALAIDEASVVRRVQIVRRLTNDVFQVFAVDIGRYFKAKENFIRQIPTEAALVPAFALEFTFAQLQVRKTLTAEVLAYLQNLLYFNDEVICKMEVYSLLSSVIHGILHVNHPVTGNADVNLNEHLMALGFAYQGQENLLSQTMHDKRSAEMMNGPTGIFQVNPAINFETTNQKLAVNGPFNPVTAKFQPILSQLQGSVVHCSSDSVNAHIMDGDYVHSGIVPRWLVATCIEKAEKADRIVLRNTTVLPRQPGLVSLILALFAPCIQLQSDDPRGYTGAITGLGFGKTSSGKEVPVYGDHDIRIYFDTLLTPSDIDSIDMVRSMVNQMLRSITLSSRALEINERGVEKLQNVCRNTVLRLLRRPRKEVLVEKYAEVQNYLWSAKTPLWDPVSGTVDATSEAFLNRVLHPIQAVPLPKLKELAVLDKLEDDLWELHMDAVRSEVDRGAFRLGDEVRMECPACRVPLRFRYNIIDHIHSKNHLDIVSERFKCNTVSRLWIHDE